MVLSAILATSTNIGMTGMIAHIAIGVGSPYVISSTDCIFPPLTIVNYWQSNNFKHTLQFMAYNWNVMNKEILMIELNTLEPSTNKTISVDWFS